MPFGSGFDLDEADEELRAEGSAAFQVLVDALVGTWVVTACVVLTGCSLLSKQVPISAANACIEKQCNAEQGKSRQECVAFCQRTYGP
jgi:hypothetical protein